MTILSGNFKKEKSDESVYGWSGIRYIKDGYYPSTSF